MLEIACGEVCNCLSAHAHTFSMQDKSGEFGGHSWTPLPGISTARACLVILAVCGGALSCCSIQELAHLVLLANFKLPSLINLGSTISAYSRAHTPVCGLPVLGSVKLDCCVPPPVAPIEAVRPFLVRPRYICTPNVLLFLAYTALEGLQDQILRPPLPAIFCIRKSFESVNIQDAMHSLSARTRVANCTLFCLFNCDNLTILLGKP